MVSTHILSAYDEDLKFLTRRIAEMGGLAEQMVSDSVRALVNSDAALAQKVISDDVILDHAEREMIDHILVHRAIVRCVVLPLRHADLRAVACDVCVCDPTAFVRRRFLWLARHYFFPLLCQLATACRAISRTSPLTTFIDTLRGSSSTRTKATGT